MPDAVENQLVASTHGLNWITLDEKGHVQIDPEALKAYLTESAWPYIERRDALLESLPRIPETIEDEETNGKATDQVGMIAKCLKAAEADREARKAPFLAATRAIDGFYHTITDPLGNPKGKDTRGQLRFIIETRMTVYQRAKAARERQAREEEARRAREAEEARRREAEEAERKAQSEAELQEAIDKDKEARQAAADAHVAEKAAAAKPAELSRTRSDLGATSSLVTFWDFRDLVRADIDLEQLREHLPIAALEQAVRSFVNAGGRKLQGVDIFENSRTRVRA